MVDLYKEESLASPLVLLFDEPFVGLLFGDVARLDQVSKVGGKLTKHAVDGGLFDYVVHEL